MGGERKTYTTLEAGRGLAALAVVLFHTNATMALPKYFGAQVHPLFSAGDSGVAFFFVLSGAVMVLAHRSQIGTPTPPGDFLWKRFRRIYLPLWPVLLLVLGAQAVAPSLGTASPGEIASAFLITPGTHEGVLAVEWTLRHEVLFYALFALMLWRPKVGTAALALWFAGSLLPPLQDAAFPLGFIFSPFHLLFLMGMGVAFALDRFRTPAPAAFVAGGLGIFAAAWGCASYTSIGHHSAPLVWAYGLGASLALLGLMELERSGTITAPRALTFLGAASYSIYLVHFPAVSALSKVALHFQPPEPLAAGAIAITCVGVGLTFHLIIERPLLRVSSLPRLLGDDRQERRGPSKASGKVAAP